MNKHNLNLMKKLLQVLKDKCVRYLILFLSVPVAASSLSLSCVCSSLSTVTMTTYVMQLSLMIEPVEVDNLQITVSQGIKTSAPHDNSCDGCNFLLLSLSSMKVMSHSHCKVVLIHERASISLNFLHLLTYYDYDNSCDATFINDRTSRSRYKSP